MCSFDVENLFTNISVHETINIIIDKLFTRDDSAIVGLGKKLFRSLLELTVTNAFFIFNFGLYKQIGGLGMGQPLGPTFANIFMCFHEPNLLEQCPSEFAPILYKRYIDDTFVLFKGKAHVHLFLNYLNSQHTSINFTMELENNNKLPFLDCLVSRDSNQLCTSVYRKPTFSGLDLSFSYCPSIFKINSMKTLIIRASAICSNYVSFDIEMKFLQQYFSNNAWLPNISAR